VGEPREVHDAAAGDLPRPRLHGSALDGGGQELAKSLHAGEQAGRLVGAQRDGGSRDIELVALVTGGGRRTGEQQRDAVGRRWAGCVDDRQWVPR
jgi:hypothetical protein